MRQFTGVSNDSLLHELHAIVGSHRRVTAELVLCLAEVDARRLHVERGFSSLFGYCVERLLFSEDEACRRIEAARLARRFPAIPPLLETGVLSLTALGLLKHHLTDENHQELLAGVCGVSTRRAKEWLAARFPSPDVPSSIRKQPVLRSPASTELGAISAPAAPRALAAPSTELGAISAPAAPRVRVASSRDLGPAESLPPSALRGGEGRLSASSRGPSRGRVEPLSQGRFLVKFTASQALRDKLERARDAMRHGNPSGELAIVFERALDLLLAELDKKQQGRTRRPLKKPRAAKRTHVTRAA